MSQALNYLKELISQGWEYPEAEFKAASKFSINASDLRDDYDREQGQMSVEKEDNHVESDVSNISSKLKEKTYWVGFAGRFMTREKIEYMGENFAHYEDQYPTEPEDGVRSEVLE